jgi:hypothetical protein
MVDDAEDDEDMDARTEGSMVNIRPFPPDLDDKALADDSGDEPDVYDVNVLAWDTAALPLHLAIVNGHEAVVKARVQEFGADVLLPVKLLNDHDKSARAAILTLVLALQLPNEKAESMGRMLVQLGASTAQADLNQTTALQYCIADRPDQLDTLVHADKTGVDRAINHLSISGHVWYCQISGPLVTAIKARDSLTALKLVLGGAKPSIGFSEYMRAYQTVHDVGTDTKQNQLQFETNFNQPVVAAVTCELPSLANTLVTEHGVDANTLTTEGHLVVRNEHCRRYTKGNSLLDEVRLKLEQLKAWKPQEDTPEPPIPMKGDSEYLVEYNEGSYRHWSAWRQVESARDCYSQEFKRYQEDFKRRKDNTGVREKRAAIQNLAGEYGRLERALVAAGGKTFAELHPEIKEPEQQHQQPFNWGYQPPEPKPFQVEFSFNLGNLTDELRDRYLSLFQAAWDGDMKLVKQLTLMPWQDQEDYQQPPLTIAVLDQHRLSPFGIAVARGNLKLASTILEIAQAQYSPPDGTKQQRYRLGDNDLDDLDDNSDDDDEVKVYSDIVDDEFTIGTIGEVSTRVKSLVTPLAMLRWYHPFDSCLQLNQPQSSGFSYFGPRKPHTLTEAAKTSSPSRFQNRNSVPSLIMNCFQLSLFNNDPGLLDFLLRMGQHYTMLSTSSDDDDEKQHFYGLNKSDFTYAIQEDVPALLETIIKQTGCGLPLDDLVKKSGVEIQ